MLLRRACSIRIWYAFLICVSDLHAPANSTILLQKHQNVLHHPPESLQVGSKMPSGHLPRAKLCSHTIPVTKETTFFCPAPPWRGLQRPQNHPQELLDAPKIGDYMAYAYRHHFFIRFGLHRGRFCRATRLASKNLHMFLSTVSQLQFLKDVLSVLHVFGNREHLGWVS